MIGIFEIQVWSRNWLQLTGSIELWTSEPLFCLVAVLFFDRPVLLVNSSSSSMFPFRAFLASLLLFIESVLSLLPVLYLSPLLYSLMVDSMVSSNRSPYFLTLALNIGKMSFQPWRITTQPKIKTYLVRDIFPIPQ